MRGSGYAIGEILIFLAIAAIIGFLIGWVVFYRRSGKDQAQLSEANPNHVRQLEGRTKAVEAKLARLEKRATALLGTLQKTGPPATPAEAKGAAEEAHEAAADESRIVPAAPAPEGAGKHGPREAGEKEDQKPVEAAPITPPETDQAGKEAPEAAGKPEEEAGPEAEQDTEAADYLAQADDRLAKLEDTLDRLSEKLAELDEG